MRRSMSLGYAALIVAQITISINVITSKYLVASLPMLTILALRFTVSTLILGLILIATRTSFCEPAHPQGRLSRTDWGLAMLQGVFAAFLFNLLFLWGLEKTSATATGIVGSTLPAIIALSAIWFLKERLQWYKVLALAIAMLGILMINLDSLGHGESQSSTHTYFGDFLIFLAMFPEAWYSILSRKLAGRMTPLACAFVAHVVGMATLVPLALLSNTFDLSLIGLFEMSLLLIAALSSLFFFLGWGWALSFIPATTAAVFGGVMPVSTTFMAILFLSEQLKWFDMMGILLVLASIVIGAGWRPLSKKPLAQAQ